MRTEAWYLEGLRRFPELGERAEHWETPQLMWFDLELAFRRAYEGPRDEEMIRRVYEFAAWCCGQPEEAGGGADLPGCVCCCFYEEIPTCPPARADMPRWLTRAEVLGMRQIFSYHVGEEGFMGILALYDTKAGRKQARERRG